MPRFDQSHVKISGCTIVWDGITRPDKNQDGTPKYTLKLVVDPNNPDLAEFHQLAQETLQQSQFKGVLPAGGRMPIGVAEATEFNGMFPGHCVISAKTKFMPDVYDENGQPLDPMQYGGMLYPGQRVDVLLHCYEYNAAGNRGISAGLDAFAIIASAQAPKLDIGGGRMDTSGAFGGGGQQQPYGPPPGQQQPPYGQPPGYGGPPPQPQPGHTAAPQGAPAQQGYAGQPPQQQGYAGTPPAPPQAPGMPPQQGGYAGQPAQQPAQQPQQQPNNWQLPGAK